MFPDKKRLTEHRSMSGRPFLVGLIFGIIAGIVKLVFFPAPQWNPPFVFPMFTAIFVTPFFWWRLVENQDRRIWVRGAVAGAMIGLITPPLMWLPYGLFLTATLNQGIEPLTWSPVYALMMLRFISPFTGLIGAMVGAAVIYFEKENSSPSVLD